MKKRFQKYFIPQEENEHQPLVLRNRATKKIVVTICAVELLILLFISPFRPDFISNQLSNLAAIFPGVLVVETNQARAEQNLGELKVSDTLTLAAQLKANDMAQKGYFAHTSPEGLTPWYWLGQAGYKYQTAGENLAVNFVDSSDVHNAWMDSPTHKANIIKGGYQEIGIAVAQGEYKGKKAVFVAQFFGTPQAANLVVATANTNIAVSPDNEIVQNPEPVSQPVVVVNTPPAQNAPIQSNQEVMGDESTETSVVEEKPIIEETIIDESDDEEIKMLTTTLPVISGTTNPPNFLTKIFASPKTFLSVILWTLASIIGVALILKIFIKRRIQYPQLVMNGLVILILVGGFTLLNRYIVEAFTEII